ncbi:hypothetical protein [Nocardia sp. NPDC046763]|uniref:alpha/beta hydrolase n=1 Tax=Nocardia sp. NPDC046763 TaxID=3155256 RepID=UPI003409C387
MICAPGWGELRQGYRHLTPMLIERGCRVAIMDIRGHGDSDAGFGSYDDVALADDILALIDELAEPAPILMVGSRIRGAHRTGRYETGRRQILHRQRRLHRNARRRKMIRRLATAWRSRLEQVTPDRLWSGLVLPASGGRAAPAPGYPIGRGQRYRAVHQVFRAFGVVNDGDHSQRLGPTCRSLPAISTEILNECERSPISRVLRAAWGPCRRGRRAGTGRGWWRSIGRRRTG